MNEKAKKKWKKIRAKGKERYILLDGLIWSIAYGLLHTIINKLWYYFEGTFSIKSIDDAGFFILVVFKLFGGFILGCLFGWIMWNWNEWSYLRSK